MIGETFFFSSHIQNNVNNNGTNPGIKESRLFCKVVILVGVSDRPDAYCSNACWIPFAPSGSFPQSM